MPIPIAPVIGGALLSGAASKAVEMAASAVGGSKGTAPGSEGMKSEKSLLQGLLGFPEIDPEALKKSAIQAGVVTALAALFLVGLMMFIARSTK